MKIVFFYLILFFAFSSLAQQNNKKVLSIDDFEGWKTISNQKISNNGKCILYEINPQKGDGNLVIHNGNKTDSIPRAYKADFGAENDCAVFHIKQPYEKIRQAKLDKVKKDKMPVDSLGIWIFNVDSISKFSKIKSYKISDENGRWIAFLTEPAKLPKDTTKTNKKEKEIEQPGDDLVFFDTQKSDTLLVKNVIEYYFAERGDAIYFVQQQKDTVNTFSKVWRFDSESGKPVKLFETTGWIKNIVSDYTASNFAFLHSADTIKEKVYSLFLGNNEKQAEKIIDAYSQGIPVGWSPSENGRIYFSRDASKLYLGTAESPEPAAKDSILEEEKPKLDIWNWKDLKLQPQQKIEAQAEKKRTYLAVYYLELERFVQLADLKIEQVSTLQKGNLDVGLGTNDSSYLRSSSWTGKRNSDYYLIDFKSGIKREMMKDISSARLSPAGKYLIWYNPMDSSFYAKSTDINQLEIVQLTKMIPVAFYDEENDRPMDSYPYGIAGWSEDDRFVFIYDRYDIWKIDPSGEKVPVCATKAFGRRNSTRLRYEKVDNELEFIPTNEPILISAFDERTMSHGYFQTKLNAVKDPDLLLMEKYSHGRIEKAKKADKIIWSKQSVKIYPDVWVSNLKFDHAEKISNVGEQSNNFVWPQVELVEWTSFSGEKLKGLLYTPENIDKSKKYPMVIYFYERSSEGLHRYQYPYPSHSTINKTFYTSNGYVVFVPDITYKIGYPGQSAYHAIVSGTQFLTQNYTFIDDKKIGLHG